jgi:hypothetical protein
MCLAMYAALFDGFFLVVFSEQFFEPRFSLDDLPDLQPSSAPPRESRH